MRTHSHWSSAVLLAVGLVAWNPLPASSHGFMSNPAGRAAGTELEDYQFCFEVPGCECDDFPEAGEIVATYEAGQTIRVSIDITKIHETDTVFRFQLCPPERLSLDCLVAGEFATVDYDGTRGPRTYNIKLPDDFVCDPCVLRWKWDYGFLTCSDIRIVAPTVETTHPSWTALKANYR